MCGCVMAGTILHSLMGKVHVVSASDGTLMTAHSTFSDCPVRLPDNNVATVLSVHQETKLWFNVLCYYEPLQEELISTI